MKKKIMGKCCICGKIKEMTYEHVPPKATFNSKPIKMYNGIDILASSKSSAQGLEGFKYVNQQRGAGDYTLCASCNNFIGDKYNPEYKNFINDIGEIIKCADNENEFNIDGVTKPIDLMAIFKQIMAMFCSISLTCANDKNLTDFILDEKSTDFDSKKYKVYLYGVHKKSKWGRIVGDTIRIAENGNSVVVSEISFFPIGLVLEINESGKSHGFEIQGTDINVFAKYDYGDKNSIEINIPVHIVSSEVVCQFKEK